MKHVIVLLFLFLGFQAMGQRYLKKEFDVDTIKTSGSADTLTFDLAQTFPDLWYYSWHVEADSLSGTVNATAYLQTSNCASCDQWDNLGTLAVSGTSIDSTFTGTMYGLRQRLYVLAPSSTQNTRFRVYALLKKTN